MKILKALKQLGLCNSQGEAKKVISQGDCFVNNQKVENFDYNVPSNKNFSIRVGKKEKIAKII